MVVVDAPPLRVTYAFADRVKFPFPQNREKQPLYLPQLLSNEECRPPTTVEDGHRHFRRAKGSGGQAPNDPGLEANSTVSEEWYGMLLAVT